MSREPRFLTKTLTEERARELIKELGFLGIVDLLQLMSETMDGALECTGPRVIVKIKRRPRVKTTRPARAASSRSVSRE